MVGDVAGIGRNCANDGDYEVCGGEDEEGQVHNSLILIRLHLGLVLCPGRIKGDFAEIHRDGWVQVELNKSDINHNRYHHTSGENDSFAKSWRQ